MPAPDEWIDRIHTRLLARYGAKWINLYTGIDPAIVKADWAIQLGGIDAARIIYALGVLPEGDPPLAGQFRALCMRMPQQAPAAIEGPKIKPDRPRLAAELQRLHDMLKERSPKQALIDLRARRAAGECLTAGQLRYLAAADETENAW